MNNSAIARDIGASVAKNACAHGRVSNFESSPEDYLALMKPRVMSLVVFTAYIGMYLAPSKIHPFLSFCALLFISIGAGASAAINMWYDSDIDAAMQRTKNRPTVTGKIHPNDALAFGLITSFFAVLLTALCINLLCAILLVVTIAYYILIYTMWLKRTSVQNVVIGGAAGALPPVVGWCAAEGSISLEPIALFLIIFLWTPPHSWALAIWKKDEYAKCKVPMMPVVFGSSYTKKYMLFYNILTIMASYLPFYLNMCGQLYLAFATMLNIGFIFYNARLDVQNEVNTKKHAKEFFIYSIFYLFTLFLIIPIF